MGNQEMFQLASGLLDLIWPGRCVVCLDALLGEESTNPICKECREVLCRDDQDYCPKCTSTIGPFSDLTHGCVRCRNRHFQFACATRLGLYDGLLRESILRIKHDSEELLAELLGELLANRRRDQLVAEAPDAIVPVPLHWRKRWSRGYNQSEAIARGVSSVVRLPVLPRVLIRVRSTESQKTLSPTKRWENLRGAFRAAPSAQVRGMRIVLIDDVLTTGATLDAAATALREAGAAQVTVAVLAHR